MNMEISIWIGLCLLSSNLLAAEAQPAAVKSVRMILPKDYQGKK